MKRSYVIAAIIATVVVVWIGSGVISEWTETAPGPTEPNTPAEAVEVDDGADDATPAVQVRTLAVEPHARILSRFGRTEADRRVAVHAETDGQIVELLVEKGQPVSEGDVLIRIAMDDRQQQLRQAETAVEHRRVAYEASRKLRQDGFRARVTIAEDAALLAAAEAALAAIRLDVTRTQVRSPFSGIIDDLPVEIGDVLTSGGADGNTTIAEIVDLDPLIIASEVTEHDIPYVSVGTPADVRLATGQEVSGVVRYVARTARETTRTFRVEVEVPNPENTISEGLTAEVHLRLGTVPAHLVTPAVLTLDDAGRLGVKAVDDDDRVAFFPVQIIDDTKDGLWVAGLPEAVRLITVGQEFVLTGQRVRAVPETGGDAATASSSGPTPATAVGGAPS